jgi:hypothetical protein
VRKVDLKKELKELYGASAKQVAAVDVPAMQFLMIDGEGDPNTSKAYAEAVEGLYSVSYTAKFMVKKSQAVDYAVMPLEGLWWADDLSVFAARDKSQWQWTMMIMQPDFVASAIIEAALADVKKKRACRRSTSYGSRRSSKARARKCCTSGRSTRKGRRSSGCTSSSMRARNAAASITRST